MVQKEGVCKYCGQFGVVTVPDDYTEEMVNEEVMKRCLCPEAMEEQRIFGIIATAEMQIKDFFKEKEIEFLKDIFLKLVEPMARHRVSRTSIKTGNCTITMKRKSDGIEIGTKTVTEEKVEA